MPTYIYRREDGTTFEVVQRMSEDPLTIDPETGQRVQRVISGAGLIFKGSGFYLTDYVRKGEDKSDSSESKGSESKGSESKAGESSDGKKESTSSESKSDTKSEPKAAPKKESASAKADA